MLGDSALIVDNFEDKNTINVNSLSQPNLQIGGITVDEFRFDRPPIPPAFNSSFYGLTTGMAVNPKESGAIFREQLKSTIDLTKREIWIRCAEVTDGSTVAPVATGFSLDWKIQTVHKRGWIAMT